MKNRDHLPVFGVGPICVYLMVAFMAIGIVLRHRGYLDSGAVPGFRIPMCIAGVILVFSGAFLWVRAVIISKVADEIVQGHLVTTGVYSMVRNPVYSGIAIALTGISLFFYNLWFLLYPFLFWLDITLMMKYTEEKWLLGYFGEEYRDYCRRVNRCIPWHERDNRGEKR